MNVNNLKAVLEKAIAIKVTPIIWGKAGIGKSQIVKQIAGDLKIDLVDLRLGQMEVGDLIGLPEKQGDKTNWLKPAWFPKENTKGILFLDEINRGRLDVLQAIFQLVLDRQLHTHKLPDGWSIICACNPNTEEYTVNELDTALLNRFLHIKYTPEMKEFVAWAKDTEKINLGITDFIEKYPHLLGNDTIDIPLEVKPTPRSWELLSKMLFTKPELHQDLWLEVAMGLVGSSCALVFIENLQKNLDKPIRADEVLNEFKKVKPTIKEYSSDKKARFDLLRITCDDIIRVLTKKDRINLDKAQGDNLCDFILALPKDLGFSIVKELSKVWDSFKDINECLSKNKKIIDYVKAVAELG